MYRGIARACLDDLARAAGDECSQRRRVCRVTTSVRSSPPAPIPIPHGRRYASPHNLPRDRCLALLLVRSGCLMTRSRRRGVGAEGVSVSGDAAQLTVPCSANRRSEPATKTAAPASPGHASVTSALAAVNAISIGISGKTCGSKVHIPPPPSPEPNPMRAIESGATTFAKRDDPAAVVQNGNRVHLLFSFGRHKGGRPKYRHRLVQTFYAASTRSIPTNGDSSSSPNATTSTTTKC